MIHLKSDSLTPTENYKLISGSLVPRPIAWVNTLSKKNILNVAPFSYFSTMPTSIPLVTLAIGRKADEQPKDTAQNVIDRKEAVIHLVGEELAQPMNQTAATLEKDQSELDLINLSLIKSNTIEVPAMVEPKVRFETKLYDHFPIKDEEARIMTDLLVMRITDFYFDEKILDKESLHVNIKQLNPLARIAGPNYATLGESFSMKRPL